MQLSVSRAELQSALNTVSRAVSPKASMPVLSGILLTAQGGKLTGTGYDLDMAIETSIPASIEGEGAVVLPAKQVAEIVKRLPRPEVTLTAEGNSVKIQAGRATFDLLSMKAADYPALPTAEGAQVILPADVLKQTVGKVGFAAAADDSRAVLTGVLVAMSQGDLTMTATDSFRLATRKVKAAGEMAPVVLPAKFLNELERAASAEVRLVLGAAWVQATVGNTRYISRLLEGEFPNVGRVMPNEASIPTWVTADRDELLGAIERVSVMCVDDLAAVQLTLDEDTHDHLLVTSTNPAVGEAREELVIFSDCADGHDSMTVALRPRYLREALRAATGKDARLGYTDNRKPILIRDEDEGYRYVVMPVMKP